MNARLLEVVAIGVLALGVRLVGLDHTPHFDEMYHVLAAESIVTDGEPRIPGGQLYDRALGFTYLVAGAFRAAGVGLVAARIPALLAGVGLVVLLFAWLRAVAGREVAWIAGVLLLLDPSAIYLSQLARFYSVHALCILVAAVGVYRLTGRGQQTPARWAAPAVAALVASAAAWHLQVTTGIALVALASWLVVDALARSTAGARRVSAPLAAVGVLAVFGSAVVTSRTDLVADLIEQVRYVDFWAEGGRGNVKYYYWLLLDRYAPFVYGFPVLLAAALVRYGRVAWYAALLFGSGVVLHSLMAWKGERYVAWSMPFFFAVVGMGLAALGRWTLEHVGSRRGRPALAAAASVIVIVLVWGGAWRYTRAMLAFDGQTWPHSTLYRGEADWASAAKALRAAADGGEVLIASAAPKALYFFDRVDVGLMATELVRRQGQAGEFSATTTPLGRPMIGEPRSIELVIDCNASGVIVVERKHMGKAWAVPEATAAAIADRTTRVEIDPSWRIDAFVWRHDGDPAACERIRRIREATDS